MATSMLSSLCPTSGQRIQILDGWREVQHPLSRVCVCVLGVCVKMNTFACTGGLYLAAGTLRGTAYIVLGLGQWAELVG